MTRRLALACALLGACGGRDTYLDGSVGLDLGFDDVRARLVAGAFELAYLRDVEGGTETVAELVVEDLPPDGLSGGLVLDLDAARASVNRVTVPDADFGPIDHGELRIHDGGAAGETIAGEFGVTFAEGATLRGGFSTTLEQLSRYEFTDNGEQARRDAQEQYVPPADS